MKKRSKANCNYYLEHKGDDSIGDDKVFLYNFGKSLMCDLFDCKNNKGKYLIEDDWIGYCVLKDIEEGIPADKNGKVIDFGKLEKSVDEVDNVDFSGTDAYRGIKPMNLKTGEPYDS